MEKLLAWNEVIKTHGNITGISSKNGLVKSLLCNSGEDQKYPNKIKKKEIQYYVGADTRSGINALFNSLEKGNSFPVFEKLGVNRWRNLGEYKAQSVKEEDGGEYVCFSLIKVK